jgi:hypothetical protein
LIDIFVPGFPDFGKVFFRRKRCEPRTPPNAQTQAQPAYSCDLWPDPLDEAGLQEILCDADVRIVHLPTIGAVAFRLTDGEVIYLTTIFLHKVRVIDGHRCLEHACIGAILFINNPENALQFMGLSTPFSFTLSMPSRILPWSPVPVICVILRGAHVTVASSFRQPLHLCFIEK